MEILSVVNHQYVFLLPVGLVLLCAGLVFAFGFKSSVEPPNFKQLSFSSDERKQGIKKRKVKDKKSQSNGHATVVVDESDSKKTDSVNRTLKQVNKSEALKTKKSEENEKVKDKKQDNQKSPSKSEKKPEKKSGKENQDGKNKKGNPKLLDNKPDDFDDGTWETAVSRKDKKNRKKDEDVSVLLTPEKTSNKKAPDSPLKKIKKEDKDLIPPLEKIKISEVTDVQNKGEQKVEAEIQQKEDVKETYTEPEAEGEVEVSTVLIAETIQIKEDNQEDTVVKKKKNKKPKVSTEKLVEEQIQPIEKLDESNTISEEKPPIVKNDTITSSTLESDKSTAEEPVSGAVFDELGDVWKEAPQKKSKKKVRKD